MTKKHVLNLLIIYFLSSNIFAQFSENDLRKLNNNQLDELRKAVLSEEQSFKEDSINEIESIESENISFEVSSQEKERSQFFGYDYFKRDINFFDNIPTPSDFKLGPGDEVILSLWGETNLRESFTINKDGMIYYSNIGFINLSNKNLREAEVLLLEELSRIYSTLKSKNNPTKLMLELGQLKSINVYFSGHIENPGIHLIHPFSDIFSAIVQSGGINDNGSLREVELIRNGKTITKIDFYSFFMSGKNVFSNIKLIDGDVIYVPNIKNRLYVSGEVNRPHYYELLPNESISDLVEYASGFTSNASSNLILNQVIPAKERLSDDYARSSIIVNYQNEKSIILNNGDSLTVPTIPDVDSQVSIFGRVKSPGNYPSKNSTLKSVLDIAGGFDDPVFRQTIREDEIIVSRQDINQFYSKEIVLNYEQSDTFLLMPNDKIFIYENINYRNSFTYRIEGEVVKPGTYAYKEGLNVGDALSLAGGITELASINNIIVSQEFTQVDSLGNTSTSQINVSNANLDFEIGANSVISVTPFENVVRVEGNVYNPGLVAFKRGLTLYDAIIQSGGYMPNSMKNRVYVTKANGEVDKANIFRGRGKRLNPGDVVFVPVDSDPDEFNLTSFISDLSSILANLAAILLIVDNQAD